jgi:hypothetical protein
MRAIAAAPAVSPPERWTTALVVELRAESDRPRAEALLRSLGGAVRALSDRALVGTALGDGDDAARTASAAACALAARDSLGGARIALVSDRLGAVLGERGKALLSDVVLAEAVVLDDATAGLLDARFEIQIRAAGNVLVGKRDDAAAASAAPDVFRRALLAGVDVSVPPEEVKHVVALNALGWMLVPYIAVHIVAGWSMWAPALAAGVGILAGFLAMIGAAMLLNRARRHLLARVVFLVGNYTGLAFSSAALGRETMIHIFLLSGAFTAFYLFPASQRRWSLLALAGFLAPYLWLELAWFPGHAAPAIPESYAAFTRKLTIFVGLPFIFIFKAVFSSVVFQRYDRALREAKDREMKLLSDELRRHIADRAGKIASALARLKTEAQPLRPGAVLEDRYRIVRPIGAGGMGAVYEVERLADHRRLALKVLTRAVDHAALARFAREAEIAAGLEHRNVVSVLDVDVSRSGTLFLVMELVTGASLAGARERFGDVAWALAVLRQIAAALAVMHARGIVHRDLKPANILVDGEVVKVADFGLARLVDDLPLAATGTIVGTPLYMAPELARGASAGGPSADVFSLGVIAFELLARELPFAAPPVLERLDGREVSPVKPLPPRVPQELGALVHACLAEDPAARPTASDVAGSLGRIHV